MVIRQDYHLGWYLLTKETEIFHVYFGPREPFPIFP